MKKYVFLILLLAVSFSASGADKRIIEKVNSFGGVTEEFTISPAEKEYEQFTKVVYFYNASRVLCKTAYYLSPAVQNKIGFAVQEEIYKNGVVAEYRMHLTPEEIEKSGINEIIEAVNPDGTVRVFGYSNGKYTAFSAADSFVNQYPLYSFDFLEKEFFTDYKAVEDDNKHYVMSAKYNKGRTFVKFSEDLCEMNDFDQNLVRCFCGCLGDEGKAALYSVKTTVEAENRKYVAYIQKALVPYISKNMDCLLAYGIIGYGRQLYLVVTEFNEIDQ